MNLQQGEGTTHWTLFIQQRKTHTKLYPTQTSDTRPHSRYANPSIQTTSETCQTGFKSSITVWPGDATSALQDCFQDTDWNMFLKRQPPTMTHTDLQEYTETVTAYIKKCIDDVTVTKTITTRANQKPWMTAEVRGLLKTRDDAFRSGDKAVLRTVRANLSRGIKKQNGYMHKKKNQ